MWLSGKCRGGGWLAWGVIVLVVSPRDGWPPEPLFRALRRLFGAGGASGGCASAANRHSSGRGSASSLEPVDLAVELDLPEDRLDRLVAFLVKLPAESVASIAASRRSARRPIPALWPAVAWSPVGPAPGSRARRAGPSARCASSRRQRARPRLLVDTGCLASSRWAASIIGPR